MADNTETQHLTPNKNKKLHIYYLWRLAFLNSRELTETNFLDFLKNFLVNKFYKQEKNHDFNGKGQIAVGYGSRVSSYVYQTCWLWLTEPETIWLASC